ncbi:MAG: translocation/assembly module TamB domain-containing protein, partial [Rubrivivax sp.]|nr:translocation/assembly module TamB domain-containing protein [Rubrivivax sp.]
MERPAAPAPAPGVPEGAPRPRPAHGKPRPLRAGLSLLVPLAWVLAIGAACALALTTFARWVLFEEEGTAWLLARAPMVAEARGVRGALLGPRWQAERLRITWDGGRQSLLLHDFESDGMAWSWRPREEDGSRALWAALRIGKMHARRVEVNPGPPSGKPLQPPASLQAPFRLQIAQLTIDELRYGTLEPMSGIAADALVFEGREGARHGVEALRARAFGIQWQARASLANTVPFELAAQATATPALLADVNAPPWAAVLRANGPLAGFDLRVTLRGRPLVRAAPPRRAVPPGRAAAVAVAGPAVDLEARVQPFESWPVHNLTARTEGLDLSALLAGAPQTRLAGEMQVQAAARDAPVVVRLSLLNSDPGRWNERRLPVARLDLGARGELARPERVELAPFEVQLADASGASAGRIEGRAEWKAHELTLEARLHEVQPQRLDGRAPAMTLAGPLKLALLGLPSPDPRAKGTPPALSASGQVDLEGRLAGGAGQRPVAVSVRAEGNANANGLELRHLQVRSGAAEAVARVALARAKPGGEWTVSSEGSLADFDPMPWWPGEADAASAAWRQGTHRLNAGWQFELRAPADALKLAPLTLAQRLAGNGRVRLHDSQLAGVPVQGEATLGYAATPGGAHPGRLHAELLLGGNHVLLEGQGDPTGSGAGDHWRAQIQAANLATLAPWTRLHASLAPWVPRRGTVQAELTADGRWPHVASVGQARSESLQVGTLTLARAQASWRLDLTELSGAAARRAPLAFEGQVSDLRLGEQRVDQARAQLRGTLAEHRLELQASLPVAPGPAAERTLNLPGAQGGGTRATLLAQGQWESDPGGGGRWLARVDELVLGPAAPGAASTVPAPGATAAVPAPGAASTVPAPGAASAVPAPGAAALPPSAAAAASSSPAVPPGPRWAEARNLRAQLQFDANGHLTAISAEPGRVRLADSFALRWDAVQVNLARGEADFAVRADIEPFLLPPLLRRLQPAIGWQGDLRLAGRIDVRAAERFEADIVFQRHDGDLHVETQGELQLLGLTEFRLSLKARDGVWDFEPVFNGRGLGEIRGRLRVQTTPERRWPAPESRIEGQLRAHVPDIGIWGHWAPPGWRLVGELATMVEVGGRFGEPTYSGELTGKGLGVRNLLQGVNVGQGQLVVRLAGTTARIETFTLKGGEGQASITGSADFGEKPGARLKLQAEHFRVLGRVDRQLSASGQAELAFDGDTARLDGRFRIDEGLFDFTRADAPSLDEDVSIRGESEAADAARAEAAANARGRPQRLALGVDIDLGQHLRAKG